MAATRRATSTKAPDEQGRSNQLARIALLQMLDEARGVGLKMLSIGEMKKDDFLWKTRYSPSFDVPAAAQKSLNDYLAVVKPAGGMKQHFQAHMDHYWRWIDSGLAMEDIEQKRQAFKGNKDREADFRIMKHLLTFTARTPEGRGQGNMPPKRQGIPRPSKVSLKPTCMIRSSTFRRQVEPYKPMPAQRTTISCAQLFSQQVDQTVALP